MKACFRSSLKVLWTVFTLLSVGLFLYAFFFHEPKEPELPNNIILLSIDTLRADHLPFYGYKEDTAPFLEQLTEQGTVLEQFYSHTPRTLPSHVTLFTSQYYSAHGISQRRERDQGMAPGSVTMASLLRDADYQTAAFTDGGWLVRELGLNEGFDIFQQSGTSNSPYPLHDYEPGFKNVATAAVDWIRAERDPQTPFFMFLHCYDVHDYFVDVPGGLRALLKFQNGQEKATREDIEAMKEAYDEHIEALDKWIHRFYMFMEKEQVLDNSLFVVLSDHGEAHGEHGTYLHGGDLYQESIHIPCIITGPNVPEGFRYKSPCGLVDILPTLCAWAQVKCPRNAQGKNLLPYWLEKQPNGAKISVFSELDRENSLESLIAWPHKLIVYQEKTWLFDLHEDPHEKEDLSELNHPTTKDLKKKMSLIVERSKKLPKVKTEKQLPKELGKRLQDLGYVK